MWTGGWFGLQARRGLVGVEYLSLGASESDGDWTVKQKMTNDTLGLASSTQSPGLAWFNREGGSWQIDRRRLLSLVEEGRAWRKLAEAGLLVSA